MLDQPQAREKARALVGAAALGSTVGLAIGGAYLAGGLARATVVHAEIQRLAGAASGGFSESALRVAASAEDDAVLAIARRHDRQIIGTTERDRQALALVDRLEARRAARGGAPTAVASASPPGMAADAAAARQDRAGGAVAGRSANAHGRTELASAAKAIAASASFRQAKADPVKAAVVRAAQPYRLRGALEQSRDLECLTQAVYYESRGESASGQKAVAQVILNRVRHPSFPKTVCGVVFQGVKNGGCQFSFACDGQPHHPLENAAWRRSESVAAEALDGAVMAEVGDATHFHAAGRGLTWSNGLMKVAQIGAHVFYKFSGHGPKTTAPDVELASAGSPRPLFASLALTGAKSAAPSHLLADASALVEHAAVAVENAAKGVAGGEARPAVPTNGPAADKAPSPPVSSALPAPAP